jgi:tRNA 2-thiocytidine biosynthesis protein TtcA
VLAPARGTLYTFADEIGATKMALGHHRDDIVETFFLNMFFNGALKAMPPKLRADDGRNVVIRPLAYCNEKDIQAYSDFKEFPIIPCNLCGSQENLQRQVVKEMLVDWERKTRAVPRASSAACRTWRRRNWPTATCSTSPA